MGKRGKRLVKVPSGNELQTMYQVCRVSIHPKKGVNPPITPKRRALRIYLELHILVALGLREAELLGQKQKNAICRCSMCNYYREIHIEVPEHKRLPLPGLKVQNIDFKTKNVTIYGKGCFRVDPKKRSPPRILPLEDQETVDLLKTYIRAKKLTSEDNILPYAEVSPRQLQRDIKDVARIAGIAGWEFVTPHKLRHFYLTEVAREGGLKVAQELGGHVSAATTLRYIHSSEEERRDAVRRVFAPGKEAPQ